jgi:hypothetical protein
MNTLRIQVVKTDRSDLLCVHCGEFGARRPMLALVGPTVAVADAIAGVHRSCIPLIKASRSSRSRHKEGIPPAFRTEPSPPPSPDDDQDATPEPRPEGSHGVV